MKLLHVVGTRPNFMKIAPVMRAAERWNAEERNAEQGSAEQANAERADGHVAAPVRFEQVLVHTGQHYDERMSKVFFHDLDLPVPDHYLEVGSGSHAQQTGAVMEALEPVVERERPDIVVVVGDVNSTLAASLVAAKLCVPIAHVEAGLRSYDRAMPEEVNRVVTDQLSNILFATCRDACENLAREGIAPERVHFVGNPMIDTLDACLQQALQTTNLVDLDLRERGYALVTLHRPSNVDDQDQLARLMEALLEIARETTVVFPVHMRTRERLRAAGFDSRNGDSGREQDSRRDGKSGGDEDPGRNGASGGLVLLEPMGYLDFLALMARARCVVTDSGGIQEETTVLGVPCVTVRTTTERPVTVNEGTNRLVDPADARAIVSVAEEALERPREETPRRPELWDGHAAQRIVAVLAEWASSTDSRAGRDKQTWETVAE
jgi:UDP-N-acetylglucosamine 2-epimerase (non-hydrolysing)